MSKVYYSNFFYVLDCVALTDEKIKEHQHFILQLKKEIEKATLIIKISTVVTYITQKF